MDTLYYKRRIAGILKKIGYLSFNDYLIYFKNNALVIKYWDGEKNWGDTLNKELFKRLTGRRVVAYDRVFNILDKDIVLGIGSIISGDISSFTIWGSGILSDNSSFHGKPKNILALRGKLTGEKFRKAGIKEPKIYGDPALLFPDLFEVSPTKKYEIGIIPHFKEVDLEVFDMLKKRFGGEIIIIDMTNDIELVAEQVRSCNTILSSSLHGLVLAESYGIPTCRLILSNRLIGGDFKFNDYYSGVGINNYDKVKIADFPTSISSLKAMASIKDLNFDSKNLKAVLLDYLESR